MRMQYLVLLLTFSILTGCSYKHNGAPDAQRLDFFLTNSASTYTSIEIGSLGEIGHKTRTLVGKEAQQVIAALNQTNRVPGNGSGRMAVVGWINILQGTNIVMALDHFDSGEYVIGDYYFFVKTFPQF